MKLPNHVGTLLRGERQIKKLTLEQVAKPARVSIAYLSDIENGRRCTPRPEMLDRLSAALGIDSFAVHVAAAQDSGEIRLRVGGASREVIARAVRLAMTELEL